MLPIATTAMRHNLTFATARNQESGVLWSLDTVDLRSLLGLLTLDLRLVTAEFRSLLRLLKQALGLLDNYIWSRCKGKGKCKPTNSEGAYMI
jgi:hypothetical protein